MSILAHCFARLTQPQPKHELRGFKVTDVNRTRKIGVACRSLQELKRKACAKLNVTNDLTEINIYLLDGSLVDDEYFHTLDAQTTLILQKPDEKILSDADLLYETLRRVNIDYLTVGDHAAKFLTENLKRKVAVLNVVLNRDDSKTIFSKREDHPEWFTGLETNITTKEAYMHRRCQDRIRGYLYKTIEQIKNSDGWKNNNQARFRMERIINYLKMQLREDHYFGYYFDRSCSSEGENNLEDNVDGVDNNCYDHCPCKLRNIIDVKIEINEENNENNHFDNDEIDAKRLMTRDDLSTTKRLAIDDEESNIYKIFSRMRSEQKSLCDSKGEFKCEGVWNTNFCRYGDKHRINPYRSHEELVLFSTWNLDHKIERSRTLVPELIKVCEEDDVNEKFVFGFYENLFTIKNLQLVHIVCHDKGSHK
ncbi:hypothetical protein PV328_000857 [Microctonus aethiopoides]|uniref:CIDE-N domain-containing protein n=1 Tax=Microctonus aethiopoides TaxID=144406 RepID=A0AA39FW90_9HYME|nr:hypothetical protein PV328_000857 [Microctonus aethiopoides]